MSTLKKSLRALQSLTAIGGVVVATAFPAPAQQANPCAPKIKRQSKPAVSNSSASTDAKQTPPKYINPCSFFPITAEERQEFEREWMGIRR